VEKQLLHIVVNAVFGLADAFPQIFAQMKGIVSSVRRFLSKYIPACSEAAAIASALDPKDGALIAEAVAVLKLLTTPAAPASAPAPLEIRTVESTQESVVPAAAPEKLD
jgi:hypothetical protein